jgi:ribosome biogenesis protein Nip4
MVEKQLNFREATLEEEELILQFIESQFGTLSLSALKNYTLWIREGRVKEAYAVPLEVNEIINMLSEDIYTAGIPLGSFSDNSFLLEIEGAALVLPFTKKILNVKTNQFLYGKPIFVTNVKNIETDFNKDEYLIIMGENNLHYGIGRAKINSSELDIVKSNSVLISGYKRKPMDRGWYLREED